jgi:hypothetical protein
LHGKFAATLLQLAALESCDDCLSASAGSLSAKFAARWTDRHIAPAADLSWESENAARFLYIAAKPDNVAALSLDVAALSLDIAAISRNIAALSSYSETMSPYIAALSRYSERLSPSPEVPSAWLAALHGDVASFSRRRAATWSDVAAYRVAVAAL